MPEVRNEVNCMSEENSESEYEGEFSDSSTSSYGEEYKYKCSYEGCRKSFQRPNKLVNHIKTHCNEKPFKCGYSDCQKAYYKKDALKRHEKRFHLKEADTVICPFKGCFQEILKDNLKKHTLRWHNSLRRHNFHCSECDKGFDIKSRLDNHSGVHGQTYKCEKCDLIFQKGLTYRKHVKYHKTYECLCEQKFQVFAELRKHKKICDKTRPRCDVCGKFFSSNYNLKQHLKFVHYSEDTKEVFQCSYDNCSKEYDRRKNLQQHIKNSHEEHKDPNKIWLCHICQKVFKAGVYLKKHKQTIHENPKPKKVSRKPRFDKGIPKSSIVTKLTGFDVASEMGDEENSVEGDQLKSSQILSEKQLESKKFPVSEN